MVEQSLMALGLTKDQSKIYLTSLKYGKLPVSVIAKKSGIKRTTAYKILEELVGKGIMKLSSINNISYYCANDPQNVIEEFKLDLKKKQQSMLMLERILPQIMEEGSSNYNSKIDFYKGALGIKTVYEKILNNNDTIFNFEDERHSNNFMPDYFKYFVKERVKRGIPIREICPYNSPTVNSQEELRQVRYIKKNKFCFDCDFILSGDIIGLITSNAEEPFGILIKDKLITKQFKTIFKLIWELVEE